MKNSDTHRHIATTFAVLAMALSQYAQDVILDVKSDPHHPKLAFTGGNGPDDERAPAMYSRLVIRMASPASGVTKIAFNREAEESQEYEIGPGGDKELNASGDQEVPLAEITEAGFTLLPKAGMDITVTCATGEPGVLHFPADAGHEPTPPHELTAPVRLLTAWAVPDTLFARFLPQISLLAALTTPPTGY